VVVDAQPLSVPDASLPELLEQTAARRPGSIAITANGSDVSYAELRERVVALASSLRRLGVEAGDRVALVLPNSPAYVMASYAAMRLGAVVVGLNVMLHAPELRRCLESTGAKLAVTLDVFLRGLLDASAGGPLETVVVHRVSPRPLPPVPAGSSVSVVTLEEALRLGPAAALGHMPPCGDLAALQHTSGSSRTPRIAALTHRNIVANIAQIERALPHADFGNGAVICLIPFFHAFGMVTCLHLPVARGYRMVLVPRFDWSSTAPLIELVERVRPVSFPAVPPLWAAMVSHPESARAPLSTVALPSSGGAPLPSWVQERFEAMTGRRIVEAYGLTEASSTTHLSDGTAPPGSVGRPLPGTAARIVSVDGAAAQREVPTGELGELEVRGPQVMRGYWGDAEATAGALHDGWLRTGDLARRDAAGFAFIVDRTDDLIVASGRNVVPAAVEAALAEHPAVLDSAVIGQPHNIRGRVVTAFVVRREGTAASPADLIDWCRGRLMEYEVPRSIVFTDAIPKTPSGKPLRRALRELTPGPAAPR
jgi:long-chain acyl-CoA synthetase